MPNDNLSDRASSKLNLARATYDNNLVTQQERKALYQPHSVVAGYAGNQMLVRALDGSVSRKDVITTGTTPIGSPVTVRGDTANAMPFVEKVVPVVPVEKEIEFEIRFFGIRSTSQDVEFSVKGGSSQIISFANADTIDGLGRGVITTKIKTQNKKLVLTFAAEIDGQKRSDLSAAITVSKNQKLKSKITCASTVEDGGSYNLSTGDPMTVLPLTNWLILNEFQKTGESTIVSGLDTTVFVSPPFPSESSEFVIQAPGEFAGAQLTGEIPKFSEEREHFLFVYTENEEGSQRSYYTYSTTWTFDFTGS